MQCHLVNPTQKISITGQAFHPHRGMWESENLAAAQLEETLLWSFLLWVVLLPWICLTKFNVRIMFLSMRHSWISSKMSHFNPEGRYLTNAPRILLAYLWSTDAGTPMLWKKNDQMLTCTCWRELQKLQAISEIVVLPNNSKFHCCSSCGGFLSLSYCIRTHLVQEIRQDPKVDEKKLTKALKPNLSFLLNWCLWFSDT